MDINISHNTELIKLRLNTAKFSRTKVSIVWLDWFADLEKDVNHPQAENSQVNNVLKIARFAKKDEQKYVYEILVWQDGILTY